MKKYLIPVLLSVLAVLSTEAQMHKRMTLLSHWNDTTLSRVDGDQIWSDIMGWKDTVKNKEYIIAGSTDSIYFFDITDPTKIIRCDVEEGHSRAAVNRDYEVYSHYVYCVSDRSSPTGSLQIFDMQYLPDSVHKVYDNDTFSINSHTLFIESESKRLYLCGAYPKPGVLHSMLVLSLADPEVPVRIGELITSDCSYTHEVYVRHDTAYCSCGDKGLHIYDMRDLNNQKELGAITKPYPCNGYNHSSWLDSTGKYLLFTDENQGNCMKVLDLHDISNPDIQSYFLGDKYSEFKDEFTIADTFSLPHNAYIKGRYAYVSNYEDGVVVYDLKDIDQYLFKPPIVAYYDTYPKNPLGVFNVFHGCWGVWPFLPSGVIIASDISEGIFVLKADDNLGANEPMETFSYIKVYPNPFENGFSLALHTMSPVVAKIKLMDISGRIQSEQVIQLTGGANTIDFNEVTTLSNGIYILKIEAGESLITQRIIKLK